MWFVPGPDVNPTNVVDPREGGNKREKTKKSKKKCVSGLARAARVTRAVSNAKEPPNIGGAVYCHSPRVPKVYAAENSFGSRRQFASTLPSICLPVAQG